MCVGVFKLLFFSKGHHQLIRLCRASAVLNAEAGGFHNYTEQTRLHYNLLDSGYCMFLAPNDRQQGR